MYFVSFASLILSHAISYFDLIAQVFTVVNFGHSITVLSKNFVLRGEGVYGKCETSLRKHIAIS